MGVKTAKDVMEAAVKAEVGLGRIVREHGPLVSMIDGSPWIAHLAEINGHSHVMLSPAAWAESLARVPDPDASKDEIREYADYLASGPKGDQ